MSKHDELEDRRKRREFDEESVWVTFPTRADIVEMTDEDLITLGKFVAGVAADNRKRLAEGLEP